jgi:Uma2 family endonuclease
VASPVSARHARPHALVIGWLGTHWERHQELHVLDNVTVILDADNEVQPDACLFREEPGGVHISDEQYVEGAPQLVVEVAASSASYDLHEKMRAYRRNGVQEYVVWRALDEAIDWFRLTDDGDYTVVQPDARGMIESTAFSGLRLPVRLLLAGDLAGVRSAMNA